MKTLIIQTSPQHTASTFLINALYGLIPELSNKRVIGDWNFKNGDAWIDNKFEDYFDDIIILKCHNTDIDELIIKYNQNYKLYFICSERNQLNLKISDKYKLYNNVVVIDFDELNESSINPLPNIMQNLYNKIHNMLNIELNIESGINRIIRMNARYEEIKELSFDYIDPFFEIHGSHRNRKS